MEENLFKECLFFWNKSDGHTSFWDDIANRHNLKNGEYVRQMFKGERQRRGIYKDTSTNIYIVDRQAPKILLFDIETSFLEIASWGINKQVINKAQILSDWYMISYSAKWLYDEKIYSGIVTPKEAKSKNDFRITNELWKLIDECDILIGYNSNNFDIPKMNTRFLMYGLNPPSSYKSIDVYRTIASKFAFTSKSLDYCTYQLQLERKMKNEGLDLWKKCMSGDQEALDNMLKYNKQDTFSLESLYLAVLPWISNHPNIGLWHDSVEPRCGYCGGVDLTLSDHLFSAPTGLYKQFRCKSCGGLGRTKENLVDKDKRNDLVRNI